MIKLAIVLPCYNEEDVLENTSCILSELLNNLQNNKKISLDSFALFVNDGSSDATWEIISKLHEQSAFFKGLNLAYNVGHQNAIMAGMMFAKDLCDAVVTIDADLQDDINAIEKMVDAFYNGSHVVYGVKTSRDADPILKRLSAEAFYHLQNKMSGSKSIYNHADFRLLSKSALDILSHFNERNLYLRGLIPMLGLPSSTVDDMISERSAGKSKYTLAKMVNLAIDGITSFSIKPIMLIIPLGSIFIIISLIILLYVLYVYFTGSVVPGWSSLMISIWFCSGISLVSFGMIGLYVGKVYAEVKGRPRYVISNTLI